jgi:7-alpha-hydroxysteroid dehydrogenase
VGGALPRPFLETTPRHLVNAFQFNVAVAHSLTQAAVPHLLAAAGGGTGAVIGITSAVGRAAGRGYLASPAAGYITGKVIEVDGGIDRPNLDLGIPDL